MRNRTPILTAAVLVGLLAVTTPAAMAAPDAHVTATINFDVNPTGVGFAAGSTWVTLDAAQVARIDPSTNRVTATIPVGNFPVRALGAYDAVWVSNCADGTVSRINPATNQVVATIATGNCPFDLGRLDGSVWVVNADNHVSRIDPATNKVIATIHAPLALCPDPFCFDFRGLGTGAGAVWVTSHRSSVLRIDPATNRVTATVRVGQCCFSLRGVAVGFGSVWASVDGLGNLIVRIDPKSLRVTARIRSVQINPGEIVVFADRVWFGHDFSPTSVIEAIDPATNRTAAAVEVGDFAGSVTAGAGSVWTNSYTAKAADRISPQ
jgi:YVTN family beta-propeller protein